MAHVGPPLPASEQPVLHHFLFVPAHLDQGDVDGAWALSLSSEPNVQSIRMSQDTFLNKT
jgi:hypothetical protein